MLAKFQHSDANCFQIFNSIKATPPSLGASVTPPFKKSNDQINEEQQKQVLKCPSVGKISKNGFAGNPRSRAEKNGGFGASLRTQGDVFNDKNGGLVEAAVSREDLAGNPDGGVKMNGNFRVDLRFGDGVEKVYEDCSLINGGRNGVFVKGKVSKNGGVREFNEKVRGVGGLRGVEDKVRAKCSTKWRRYGGCIPAMLEALEVVEDLDEALKPWAMNLTNKERSILLKEQLQWERAMEIFEWFKGKGCYEVNVIHYNIMLRILGKARQWCEVERLWGEMVERGIQPINSTYGTLIDVYSKGGLREEAIKYLELMKERRMEPDEVTMGNVVQMYKKAGEFETAEEFFKKWSVSERVVDEPRSVTSRSKRGANGDSGANACLSVYTYNTLIDTYGKGGKLQEASETFERMLEEEIVPTTVTFNTVIHMYGNNGQLGEVASLIKKMEEVNCSPDTRTFNILISLYAKHDDIDMASIYLKKMKDASLEPDAVTYRTLLYAFSIRQMVSQAEDLVSEMDERGLEIDEFTQSSLTRMYIESGMLESSWAWFERFHIAGNMSSECYSANIDAFGERGHVLESEKVFNCCLEKKRLSVLEFNVMIKAYGISKKFEQACCLFDSMDRYGVIPDRCSYNSLVQMLSSADLPQKATFYLTRMQQAGLVLDCVPYCAVISSYSKLGQVDMAVSLYEEMVGYDIKPDAIVFGVLINAFADTGIVKEAKNYVKAMRDLDLPVNDVICKSLIKLYTKVGLLGEAREAYKALQSFEAGVDVCSSNCMIDLFSERSMISEAERIFKNLIQSGNANEFSYAMMLRMYKKNGRFVEAFGIARKMREQGLMTDLLSFNNVLGLYASDGRFKEAAATFDEMLRSDIQPDNSTFKTLKIVLLKCGVPTSAVHNLELIRKKDAQKGLQAWTSTLRSVIG
ncbi:pentatricopeptide repeat-containing protein At3g23020-like [Primulina huaijiensis]|uniref:pentatricopeptide repeat-containing protein At3g23020-like n=1 Tax=Primulina huaijiensis TaxID=1492673 RepID=UPI003CC74410